VAVVNTKLKKSSGATKAKTTITPYKVLVPEYFTFLRQNIVVLRSGRMENVVGRLIQFPTSEQTATGGTVGEIYRGTMIFRLSQEQNLRILADPVRYHLYLTYINRFAARKKLVNDFTTTVRSQDGVEFTIKGTIYDTVRNSRAERRLLTTLLLETLTQSCLTLTEQQLWTETCNLEFSKQLNTVIRKERETSTLLIRKVEKRS